MNNPTARSSGILLHVSSLPGPWGIGDLGPAAWEWIDDLAAARQTWWQTLPITPPGEGHSPYQSYSAFAGNPDLINPDSLVDDGLLSRSDLPATRFAPGPVDYRQVGAFKRELLARAWQNFQAGAARSLRRAFESFQSVQGDEWLDDFALFMALKDAFDGVRWTRWPKDLVNRTPAALANARHALQDEIGRQKFIQFLFFRQLEALRRHARQKGVKIIGDLPMFVSAESADVWANPHLFRLDALRRPTVVAGVPPDFFSASGQRWGNPLYDWPAHERDGFRWWVARVRAALAQADVLRIDHFRGLEACWEIPAAQRTAKRGRWVKSPGAALLATLRTQLRGLPFIAEDLGLITPDVERLRDQFGLPGMRVLQFAFSGDGDNPHLPHNFVRNAVAYTGTHDNDTVAGWHRTLDGPSRRQAHEYSPELRANASWAMLRLAWASVATIAIAPAQDVLGLGREARMNVPGRPTGNWRWRLRERVRSSPYFDRLAAVTALYGRSPRIHVDAARGHNPCRSS